MMIGNIADQLNRLRSCLVLLLIWTGSMVYADVAYTSR